jgi:hypothetical protein
MKIDPSKKYQTRSGRPVTLLHRVPEGWPASRPWRGLVDGNEMDWLDSGTVFYGSVDGSCDLVEVREPMRVRIWIKDGHGPIFCVSDTELTTWNMNQLGYTLKEFVEVMP